MHAPDLAILYVADTAASTAFYARLFGRPAAEASPAFAMFVADGGLRLGLWRRDAVQPPVDAEAPGAGELVFHVADAVAVERCHAQWRANGVQIVQARSRSNSAPASPRSTPTATACA